ncbi:MAG: hypothetical protein ACM37W_06975 [Actinomycetota bacterium]
MAANYEQPTYLDKRLRYFDGQFLKDQDFIDEQKYHVDRLRRLSRILQVSGISEGLTVAVAGIDRASVSPGTAVDPRGRLIVLATQEEISVANYRSKPISLVISYQEIETDRAQEGSAGNRRWHEKPLIQAVADGETVPPDAIVLARLNINRDGIITVDTTVRQYSGVSLPAAGGRGPTLRSAGDSASNKAIFTGDLSVTGSLDVNRLSIGSGGITAANATINGNLTVSGSITGGSLSLGNGNFTAGSATINGNLTVSGSITGSSLSLGSGSITAGDIVGGKITSDNFRTQIIANDPVSTVSWGWEDIPKMTLTITANGKNFVLVLFNMGGIQGVEKALVRARFQIIVDNVQKAFSWHEYHNNGWELGDATMFALDKLDAGPHTIKVQWCTEPQFPGRVGGSAYNSTRSLMVIEL